MTRPWFPTNAQQFMLSPQRTDTTEHKLWSIYHCGAILKTRTHVTGQPTSICTADRLRHGFRPQLRKQHKIFQRLLGFAFHISVTPHLCLFVQPDIGITDDDNKLNPIFKMITSDRKEDNIKMDIQETEGFKKSLSPTYSERTNQKHEKASDKVWREK